MWYKYTFNIGIFIIVISFLNEMNTHENTDFDKQAWDFNHNTYKWSCLLSHNLKIKDQ